MSDTIEIQYKHSEEISAANLLLFSKKPPLPFRRDRPQIANFAMELLSSVHSAHFERMYWVRNGLILTENE